MAYIIAAPLDVLFVDRTYQRELDKRRAQAMADKWDPELVGVLDVSDRGDQASPRYAVINGQHRLAAATLRDPTMQLPINVHRGLTLGQEAKLFFDIDANTRALTTWDRWYARKASGDPVVVEIERVVGECGYVIAEGSGKRAIQCCTTLEKIWQRAGAEVLAETLTLISDVWSGLQDAVNASIVDGIAWLIDYHDVDLETGRLGDAMSDFTPKQVRIRAIGLREEGTKGSMPLLVASVLTVAYNRQRGDGPKLPRIDVREAASR
jgi:hypothetical protein